MTMIYLVPSCSLLKLKFLSIKTKDNLLVTTVNMLVSFGVSQIRLLFLSSGNTASIYYICRSLSFPSNMLGSLSANCNTSQVVPRTPLLSILMGAHTFLVFTRLLPLIQMNMHPVSCANLPSLTLNGGWISCTLKPCPFLLLHILPLMIMGFGSTPPQGQV